MPKASLRNRKALLERRPNQHTPFLLRPHSHYPPPKPHTYWNSSHVNNCLTNPNPKKRKKKAQNQQTKTGSLLSSLSWKAEYLSRALFWVVDQTGVVSGCPAARFLLSAQNHRHYFSVANAFPGYLLCVHRKKLHADFQNQVAPLPMHLPIFLSHPY